MNLAFQSRNVGANIQFIIKTDQIETSLDIASPIGLVINELATNSVKYAFPNGRAGLIHLSMHLSVGHVKLDYGDDGVGMSADFVPDQEGHLGLTLIKSLIERQLRGSYQMDASRGFNCTIEFDVPVFSNIPV